MKKAELRHIRKIFETRGDAGEEVRSVAALDDVTLTFNPGEIHAILGENGAGKSTLVHILSGLHRPTSGVIAIGDSVFNAVTPSQAIGNGIAMVHQRPLLCDELTVTENILLGSPGFLARKPKAAEKIRAAADAWGIELDLSRKTHTLSAAERFYAALLGALLRSPDLLILDEPASILAAGEHERFFTALRAHCSNGLGAVLITHRVAEAVRWSDRVSVLREGKLLYSGAAKTLDELERMIDPEGLASRTARLALASDQKEGQACKIGTDGTAGLSVRDLSASPPNRTPLSGLTFCAPPGKITAIYGLPGSGLSTLEDALSGMLRCTSGSLATSAAVLEASEVAPSALRKAGLACVPSNRTWRGSNPELAIGHMLCAYRMPRFISSKNEAEVFAKKILEDERINAPLSRKTSTLSGGQLQRLVLDRELAEKPSVLVLSEPEWGLDIKSAAALRVKLTQAAQEGTAVLVLTDNPDSFRDPSFFSNVLVMEEGVLI